MWDRVLGAKGKGMKVSVRTETSCSGRKVFGGLFTSSGNAFAGETAAGKLLGRQLTPCTFAQVDPSSTRLLITEPVLNLPNVQEHYDQMVFEEYEFASYLRCPGASLPRFPYSRADLCEGPSLVPFGADTTAQGVAECVLVVDSGFSFTHVVPVVKGTIVASGVRR